MCDLFCEAFGIVLDTMLKVIRLLHRSNFVLHIILLSWVEEDFYGQFVVSRVMNRCLEDTDEEVRAL